jgi:hypothetical protein
MLKVGAIPPSIRGTSDARRRAVNGAHNQYFRDFRNEELLIR